jgi:hypothetical protein
MLQPALCCFQQILAPAVVVLALPMYIAAGLQQRWQADMLPATPAWQFAAAAVVHALCTLLGCWALCTNKFFSSVVSVPSVCRLAVLCCHPVTPQQQNVAMAVSQGIDLALHVTADQTYLRRVT